MGIIYKNRRGVIVTHEQARLLDDYEKTYEDDITHETRKREYYRESKLSAIYYFIESFENESVVVDELSKQNAIICINRKSQLGPYTIINTNQYDADKNLTSKSKTLVNSDNKEICYQAQDIATNLPLLATTIKMYYDDDHLIFDTQYNEDGSLDRLIFMTYDEQDWEYYNSDDFEDLQNKFDEDISYYYTAEFEPRPIR